MPQPEGLSFWCCRLTCETVEDWTFVAELQAPEVQYMKVVVLQILAFAVVLVLVAAIVAAAAAVRHWSPSSQAERSKCEERFGNCTAVIVQPNGNFSFRTDPIHPLQFLFIVRGNCHYFSPQMASILDHSVYRYKDNRR